jgi:hypothetical protein
MVGLRGRGVQTFEKRLLMSKRMLAREVLLGMPRNVRGYWTGIIFG